MNFPAELKYSKSHEWVRMDGEIAVVGISDFAQDALGDVVFINLPTEGDAVTAGESFGDVESVKAVSDIISPVSGTICAVNEALADAPETLNSDPYGAWIIKVEGIGGTEELLDAAAYEAHCAEEGLWSLMFRPPRRNGRKCLLPSGSKALRTCIRRSRRGCC